MNNCLAANSVVSLFVCTLLCVFVCMYVCLYVCLLLIARFKQNLQERVKKL